MVSAVETVVVRIWVPAEAGSAGGGLELHGFVEHVGSGRSGAFQSAEELLALITAEVSGDASNRAARERAAEGDR